MVKGVVGAVGRVGPGLEAKERDHDPHKRVMENSASKRRGRDGRTNHDGNQTQPPKRMQITRSDQRTRGKPVRRLAV